MKKGTRMERLRWILSENRFKNNRCCPAKRSDFNTNEISLQEVGYGNWNGWMHKTGGGVFFLGDTFFVIT